MGGKQKKMVGERNNERPGNYHVTSGPMRGLEINCTRWRKQTHTDKKTVGHGDSMTELAGVLAGGQID